jgi:hypothetical protein
MIFLPALYLFAASVNSVSYLGNECYYDGQCQPSRTCYVGRCLSSEEVEEMRRETKKYKSVSGEALFIVAVFNAGASITAESGGLYPWIGPSVYLAALVWIAMIQVSSHMAVNQLMKLGIPKGKKLNRLIAAGWGLLGVATATWIACIVLHIRTLSYSWPEDPNGYESSKNYGIAYLIELYGVAVPLAIAALGVAIRARVVAARKVKSVIATANEKSGTKSKMSFSPCILPSSTGFAIGLGGAF